MNGHNSSYNERRRSKQYSSYAPDRPHNTYESPRGIDQEPRRMQWGGRKPSSNFIPVSANGHGSRFFGFQPHSQDRSRSNNLYEQPGPASFRGRPETLNSNYRTSDLSPGCMTSTQEGSTIPGLQSHGSRSYQSNMQDTYDNGPVSHANHRRLSVPNDYSRPQQFNRPVDAGWPSKSVRAPSPGNPLIRSRSNSQTFLEPSPIWRREQEERNRKLSLQTRDIIPATRQEFGTDPYSRRNGMDSMSTGTGFYQRGNDSQNVRYLQDPSRNPLPARNEKQHSFPAVNRYQQPYRNPKNNGISRGRKPFHRTSARISARPHRSPSPSSSSGSSVSGRQASRQRSETDSRSSRFSSPGKFPQAHHGPRSARISAPRRYSPDRNKEHQMSYSNSTQYSPRRDSSNYHRSSDNHERWLQPSFSRRPSSPGSYQSYDIDDDSRNDSRLRNRSRSYSPHSSIQSSARSSPDLATTEILPEAVTPSDIPGISLGNRSSTGISRPMSSIAQPISLEDAEDFELPGLRFQANGALKPGLKDPVVISLPDIPMDISESPEPAAVENPCSPVPMEIEDIPPADAKSPESAEDKDESMMQPLQEATRTVSLGEEPRIHRLSPDQGREPPLEEAQGVIQIPNDDHNEESLFMVRDCPEFPRLTHNLGHHAKQSEFRENIRSENRSPVCLPRQRQQEPLIDSRSLYPMDQQIHIHYSRDMSNSLRSFLKSREVEPEYDFRESVLQSNVALKDSGFTRIATSNDELVREVFQESLVRRSESHAQVSQTLLEKFTQRAEELAEKTRRLRAEYKTYHNRWMAYCQKLDEAMAASAAEGIPARSTRASRRSGFYRDVVRSDFEMEEIIASLGTEDLTDPNVLAMRNMANIPDLLSTTDPRQLEVDYVDDNGLVDDPVSIFDVYDAVGCWTADERDIFLQKYAAHPKQFGVIAEALPGKTQAQCVLFYYLHKKDLIDFRDVVARLGPKRKRGRKSGKGKSNALLTDIRKTVLEEDALSQKHAARFQAAAAGKQSIGRRANLIRPSLGSSSPAIQPEPTPSATSVLDLPAGSQSQQQEVQETSTTPINVANLNIPTSTSEVNLGMDITGATVQPPQPMPASTPVPSVTESPEKPKEKPKRPPGRPPKKHKQQGMSAQTGTATSAKPTVSYIWTEAEKETYFKLLSTYGRDFERIAAALPEKTLLVCKNYYKKNAKELEYFAEQAELALAEKLNK